MSSILQTKRLILREMSYQDITAMKLILQDKQVMYAYEHAFDDQEVFDWIQKQIDRYHQDGFGLWAVVHIENNQVIGQCGITKQFIGELEVLEVGYLFAHAHWHQGYATEAAKACIDYVLATLHTTEVYAIIRDNNQASIQVALRNGMEEVSRFTKHYYHMDMPHIVYRIQKNHP